MSDNTFIYGNENGSNTPKSDLMEYAERYGMAALGYAIYELIRTDSMDADWTLAENVWEFGGNDGNN